MWEYISGGVLLAIIAAIVFVSDRPPKLDPKGKRVIITGGSSGIGLATALQLAAKGSKVALVARNAKKLEEATREVNAKHPGSAVWVAADVGDNASIAKAVDECAAKLGGGVDILVHSAGISRPGMFEEVPLKDFENLIHVNYMGSVYVTRAVVPHLKAAGGGRLVYVSSLAGMTSVTGLTAYSPTKYAVRGLAEGLQMELRPFGIYTTVVNPPDVDTPMYKWEMGFKPVECKRISEGSGLFSAEAIAGDIVGGIERWSFYVSTGFDGILSNSLCAGMAPASSIFVTLLEVLFGGVVRLVSLFYLKSFNDICTEEHTKKQKAK